MFTLEDMRRFLTPLKNKIYNIVGLAVLTAFNNSMKTRMVQVQMADEVFEMEYVQDYGMETYPDPTDENNETLFLAIGGNRGLGLVVLVNNREERPKTLVAGEVMLYSKHGQKIHLKADGSVLVSPAAGKAVNLRAENGNAVMLDTIISKLNNHVHGGVTTGGGSTGSMTLGGTMLVAGTDSAANVKAKTG